MLPVYTISICLKSFLSFQSGTYKKEYKKCYTILTENLVLEINVVSEPEVFLVTHIITTTFQIIFVFVFILISCLTCYLFFLFLSFAISLVDAGGRCRGCGPYECASVVSTRGRPGLAELGRVSGEGKRRGVGESRKLEVQL